MTTEPDIQASGSKGSQVLDEAQDSVPARRHWILVPLYGRPGSSKQEVHIEESSKSQVTAQTKSFHQFESPSHLPSLIRMKSIYVHNS
jgi:hypothetical protein